jgi:hypothetical protein
LLRLLYNLVILPWRNFTMMFAPLHLFALGREEECALLGALMLVVNVSSMEEGYRIGAVSCMISWVPSCSTSM